MSLKENLIRYMKNKNLQIKELSAETNISEPTLKRLRTQTNTNPTLDVLAKLATALEVTVNDLIQDEISISIFHQDQNSLFNIENESSEFILIFTKDTFSFKSGSKALFKKLMPGMPITKYIANKQGKILERVGENKWLYRDEKNNNYSVDVSFIFAVILKELYEVSYV